MKIWTNLFVMAATVIISFSVFARADRPNVIIIYADDLGIHDLSVYRDTAQLKQGLIATPNCDRLAQNGLVFTDAHSSSAVCTPSRYSLLTGRYAWRTWLKAWVVQEHMPLLIEEDRYTMGKMLQDAGYTTGIVGKWHLGWGRQVNDFKNGKLVPGPLECGFDEAFTVPFSHNSTKHMRVFVEGRQVVGVPEGALPGSDKGLVRSLPDTATDLSVRAVQFIDEYKDQPFFLYYPTTNVHFPLTPHERFEGKSGVSRYGDFVVEFDWAVGEVMAALERHGIADNTILIVTSDNGSNVPQSNPFYRGRKCYIYEGGHRVPMIMSWPGHTGKRLVDTAVCQTDLMPTFAAMLDVSLPEGAAEDGENILPLLKGEALPEPRKAIIHHSLTGRYAIRKGKWKLMPNPGNHKEFPVDWAGMLEMSKNKPVLIKPGKYEDLTFGLDIATKLKWDIPGELFDLESDPRETTNVWDENPDIVEQLLDELLKERMK